MKNKNPDFPIGGMLFLSALGIFGLFLMLFPLIKAIENKNILIFFNGIAYFLFGFVFFIFCFYAWIAFIKNVLIKPKEETLYLLDTDTFLNQKGRKIFYNSKNLEKNKYYKTIKTSDYIEKINEESDDKFELKIKEKYWLNWYSPYGNFEEILLLPIVYIIFLILFLSSVLSPLPYNFIVAAFGIYPSYLIIYDIIKKNEKNKENQRLLERITKSDK